MSEPDRIRSRACRTASAITWLPVTCATTRRASAIDIPEPSRVARVEENRETIRCLISGPKPGRASRSRSRSAAPRVVRTARRYSQATPISAPRITSTQGLVSTSEIFIRARVGSGRVWPTFTNSLVITGRNQIIITSTTIRHTVSRTAGYIMAVVILSSSCRCFSSMLAIVVRLSSSVPVTSPTRIILT